SRRGTLRSASPDLWVRSPTPSSRQRLTPPLSRIRGTTRACGPHHRHGPAASSPLAARISFFPHLLYSHAPGRSTNPAPPLPLTAPQISYRIPAQPPSVRRVVPHFPHPTEVTRPWHGVAAVNVG